MNRADEPGYVLAAMNDPSGRRGIWYRDSPAVETQRPVTQIEICGGREGDDCYVKISVGDTVTPAMLRELEDILSRGAWMVNEQKAQAERERFAALTPDEQLVEIAFAAAEDNTWEGPP